MRCAALLALIMPVATAQAEPLVAQLVDSEYTISRLVQFSPTGAPNVRTRGGVGGGSSSSFDLATASSFGEFFPFSITTLERENLITADLEASVGTSAATQVTASCTAYRFAWIQINRPVRYRITGHISSELSLGEGDWGGSMVNVEITRDVDLIAQARVDSDEGAQTLEIEGVLDASPMLGQTWYFLTFEASASLTTDDLLNQQARAIADVTVELLPFGCSFADLAAPYGVLNSSDIIEFLEAWNDADPIADYEPPFGHFDLSDVLAFLNEYGRGCP